MTYPKQVMRLNELISLGFAKSWLMMIYNRRGQKIAWKMSPGRNSPILFDTEALEKFRTSQCGTGRGAALE